MVCEMPCMEYCRNGNFAVPLQPETLNIKSKSYENNEHEPNAMPHSQRENAMLLRHADDEK